MIPHIAIASCEDQPQLYWPEAYVSVEHRKRSACLLPSCSGPSKHQEKIGHPFPLTIEHHLHRRNSRGRIANLPVTQRQLTPLKHLETSPLRWHDAVTLGNPFFRLSRNESLETACLFEAHSTSPNTSNIDRWLQVHALRTGLRRFIATYFVALAVNPASMLTALRRLYVSLGFQLSLELPGGRHLFVDQTLDVCPDP